MEKEKCLEHDKVCKRKVDGEIRELIRRHNWRKMWFADCTFLARFHVCHYHCLLCLKTSVSRHIL